MGKDLDQCVSLMRLKAAMAAADLAAGRDPGERQQIIEKLRAGLAAADARHPRARPAPRAIRAERSDSGPADNVIKFPSAPKRDDDV
jgi:hypothetical protein